MVQVIDIDSYCLLCSVGTNHFVFPRLGYFHSVR